MTGTMTTSIDTRHQGARRGVRAAIVAALVALAALSVSVPTAFGAYNHATVENEFGINECLQVEDIAILEPEGLVYVSCRVGTYPNEADQVLRFHLNGEPAPFSASASYISGNRLIADPGSEDQKFDYHPDIAVDSSASPNHGKLFVNSAPNVDIFNTAGEHVGAIFEPIETTIPNRLQGIDVGPDGSIYVTSDLPGPGRVSKYNPALQEVRRAYPSSFTFFSYNRIRVDNNGALWFNPWQFGSEGNILRKYEADQFTEELKPKFGTPTPERFYAVTSPFAENPVQTSVNGIDVDLNTNDVLADRGNKIETFSEGTAAERSHPDAPVFGEGKLNESIVVAVTRDHHVYAGTSTGGGPKIVVFGPGDIVPDIRTAETNLLEVGHTTATLHGTIERAGGAPITNCKLEYVQTNNPKPSSYPSSVQCTPDAASSPPGSNFTEPSTDVAAQLSGLTQGATYHYRFSAENEHGKNVGIDRIVVPAFVIKLQTLAASNVNTEGATLNASFDPDGKETKYRFQYGLSKNYGLETELVSAGSGSGVTTVGLPVSSLPSGRTFHYRVIASNSEGTTFGADRTFRTSSAPDIGSVHTTNVTGSSAELHAGINPVGFDTTYQFEYGPTTSYGQVVPAEPEDIGEGTEPVSVTKEITGLEPGVTYHFHVVAKNKWGTTESADTTFDFEPPSCPNGHVRQETGASYLPDCRAYELVSPVFSGSVLLYPGEKVATESNTCCPNAYDKGIDYILNEGYAKAPARFTFYGGLSTPPELHSPVGIQDMYMSTRTNQGWVASVPGLQESDAFETARKECSESMDECIDHTETEFGGFHREFAPYRYTADGRRRGRLPTNVALIPGGRKFVGAQAMSADFSHYAFSSGAHIEGIFGNQVVPAIVFAPGGRTEDIGSAYDNNINTHEVEVISKLPGSAGGGDIPLQAASTWTAQQNGFNFRGVSKDGSHILIETPAEPSEGPLAYLFMRVNDAVTYDISEGHPVTPIGMTRDGSKVFFTTNAQMTEEDEDSSADLYMWREDGSADGELKLLSTGNGEGNSDACSDSWGPSGCGVTPLTPEDAHANENLAVSGPGMDDLFAEDSGDIYFYSPENLDPELPGVRGERNLYVYRNGGVHFVATMDSGKQITRMQISPDGGHAAMRTASQMTSYDNKGFQEIYTFNPDTGLIRCASCDPTGGPPTANVEASQNGRFMADDGRTFFASKDSLDPRDRDGKITDVYEYVDGRPQLITKGQGNKDFTGGSEVFNLFAISVYTGLEAVSHDGVDVFFSTYDTLVKRDHNGEYVKFYDARTGGGFPEEPELLPCEAADECHGADSSPPPPPAISSAGNLGGSGNIAAPKPRKRSHGKRRAHRKHHRSKKRHHRHGTRRVHG